MSSTNELFLCINSNTFTDLKRVPELTRRALSCVEDEARIVGGNCHFSYTKIKT